MSKFKGEQIPKYFKLLDAGIAARGNSGYAVGSNVSMVC